MSANDGIEEDRQLYLSLWQRGKQRESIALAEETLSFTEQRVGVDDPSLLTDLRNIAVMYSETGQFDKAGEALLRAVQIESRFGTSDPVTDVNLATRDFKAGSYGTAEDTLRDALRRVALEQGESLLFAAGLSNLGVILAERKQYADAKLLSKWAIAIAEREGASSAACIGTYLNNLGESHLQLGEYDDALDAFNRALSAYRRHYGEEHVKMAACYQNLGCLFAEQGNTSEAEDLYFKSMRLLEDAFGPEHPRIARVLSNIGDLYCEQKEYEKALPYLERSVSLRSRVLGNEHPDLGFSLFAAARVYEALGEVVMAEESYLAAKDVFAKAYGPTSEYVGYIARDLGDMYDYIAEEDKARQWLESALAILCEALPEGDERIAEVRERLNAVGSQGEE